MILFARDSSRQTDVPGYCQPGTKRPPQVHTSTCAQILRMSVSDMRKFAHVCFKHAQNLRMSGLRSYYVFLRFNKTAVLFLKKT